MKTVDAYPTSSSIDIYSAARRLGRKRLHMVQQWSWSRWTIRHCSCRCRWWSRDAWWKASPSVYSTGKTVCHPIPTVGFGATRFWFILKRWRYLEWHRDSQFGSRVSNESTSESCGRVRRWDVARAESNWQSNAGISLDWRLTHLPPRWWHPFGWDSLDHTHLESAACPANLHDYRFASNNKDKRFLERLYTGISPLIEFLKQFDSLFGVVVNVVYLGTRGRDSQ